MKRRFRRPFLYLCICFILALSFCPAEAAAATSKTYTYYYNHLSGYRKKVYKKIRKAWYQGNKEIIVVDSRGYNLDYAGMWVLNDFPEYFWCNSYSSGSGFGLSYFRMATWKNAIKQKTVFNKRVKAVYKTLKKQCTGKSTAEKAVILHDWVCNNCTYKTTNYDQTAYGVFVKKKAVCAGYARAYKLLCDKFSIKCICVNVLLNNVPHLINFVRVDGKWYMVDCTNDQGTNGPLRMFCLVGSDTIGTILSSSCGVTMPTLSVSDYPLSDREAVKTAQAKVYSTQYSYGGT